jgi:hypothetical protein
MAEFVRELEELLGGAIARRAPGRKPDREQHPGGQPNLL